MVSARCLRVLIVDDNHDAADSQAALVSLWGHETRVAYDGHEALAEALRITPDVALLDLGLPGLDGFAVAQQLHQSLPLLTLIAVTGYGDARTQEHARQAGFAHCLLKPADPETLQHLLDAARQTAPPSPGRA